MKIHFEGTRKEIYRQLLIFYLNLDWRILDLSDIKSRVGFRNSFSFDIIVESRIPYKKEEEYNEDGIYISMLDRLYSYDVPLSRMEVYREAYDLLSSYIEKEENLDIKDIRNKLKECKKMISDNKEEIEYYETHRLAKNNTR